MPTDEGRWLLMHEAGMNVNPFNFGYPPTRTTYNSYIPQLPDASYDIYRPWQWNHLCFAWSSGGKSKLVLVLYSQSCNTWEKKLPLGSYFPQNGEFLNINFIDENLKDLTVPTELLLKVYLMRCANDYEKDCTAPGAMATDFNIWSRSFDDRELIEWTSCK